jgi:hypothetical protein
LLAESSLKELMLQEFVNFSKAVAELGLYWTLTNQAPG